MHESLEDFIETYPGGATESTAIEALVGAALSRALKPHLRVLMSVGVTIIEVPDTSWLAEARRQAKQIWSRRPVEIAPDTSKTSRDTESKKWWKEIRGAIVAGYRPIIITVDAVKHLPRFVSAAADLVVTVPPLQIETVIEAARMVLRGQVRRYFRDMNVSGLDLDTVGSCLARGTHAKTAAQRLRNASARVLVPTEPIDGIQDLDNAAGYGEALDWSKNLIADLNDYQGGKLPWSELDSAAVLHGPPGTGKSLFARITANAAGVPLLTTSIAELFTSTDGHLDKVLKRLRAIFDEAREKAPCLLFIDEIDGLPSRGAGGHNENYWRPVVNDLLMILDSSTSQRDGIIILAATNRLVDVDPALLRSQRLDRLLYVGPPEAAELSRILRYYLKDDLPEADLVSLASVRPGATGADAVSWTKNARRRARRAQREMAYEDLVAEVVGVETRSPTTMRRVAVHEAGHVVAAYALGLPLDVVTLVSDGRNGGHTMLVRDTQGVQTKSEQEREVVVMLSGRAAEHAVLGNDHSTASGGAADSDIAQATSTVTHWHVSWGLGDGLVYRGGSETVLERDASLRQAVKVELDRLYGFAKGIMVTHYLALIALSEALLERQTLRAEDVRRIIEPIWDPDSRTVL